MIEIPIAGEIGVEVQPEWLRNELKKAGGSPIRLLLNSPGGYVGRGWEMVHMIKSYPGQVEAIITGYAASAASILAITADTLIVDDISILMIHCAAGGAYGNSTDMKEEMQILNGIDRQMARMYAQKSGHDEEIILSWMKETLWLFDKEILEYGFADKYTGSGEVSDTDRDERKDEAWQEIKKKDHPMSAFEIREIAAQMRIEADSPTISPDDIKAAKAAGMTVEEYIKVVPEYERAPITDDERNTAMRMNITVPQLRRYRNG